MVGRSGTDTGAITVYTICLPLRKPMRRCTRPWDTCSLFTFATVVGGTCAAQCVVPRLRSAATRSTPAFVRNNRTAGRVKKLPYYPMPLATSFYLLYIAFNFLVPSEWLSIVTATMYAV